MDLTDKHIVTIDLGSSKLAITVAKVNGCDVQIIYYKETASSGIRYSSVFNVMHVTEPLRRLIREAEEELGIKITQAVVGMPKFPIGVVIGILVGILLAVLCKDKIRSMALLGGFVGFVLAVPVAMITVGFQFSGILAILLFICVSPVLGLVVSFLFTSVLTRILAQRT